MDPQQPCGATSTPQRSATTGRGESTSICCAIPTRPRIRDAGMPLQLIARQLGHKWLRTTEHYYVGIDREIADEVIRKVLSEL